MVIAIGVASSEAAMYHLFTHACFKALLFLGAGSVIHALHHEQDMWKMGGLSKQMPVTFWTFLIGTLALTGCPFLAGYYSKDSILLAAYTHSPAVFWIATGTVFLTAFYMFRLVVVAFLGRPKADHHGHESPFVMTFPLMVLGVLSVIAGYPFFAGRFLTLPHEAHNVLVPVLSLCAFVSGAGLAVVLYSGKSKDPIYIPLLANKFYIDEIYAVLIRNTQDLLARVSGKFDRLVLDGALVRGLCGGGTYSVGFVLRLFQVGNLQGYAFLFGAGVVGLIYFMIFK
jgi:NADH-quinone oxidoreductase subunit L